MKFDVNQDKCLRCGMCTGIAIDVFEFDDDGNIKVNNENINEENKNDVESATDNCPVGAIEEKANEE